jgi:hypothetical protein
MNHWSETADRVNGAVSSNPLFGHLGEDDNGELLLPAWWRTQRAHCDESQGGWWNRRLNLRCPWHWLPYLRSRISGRLVFLERP